MSRGQEKGGHSQVPVLTVKFGTPVFLWLITSRFAFTLVKSRTRDPGERLTSGASGRCISPTWKDLVGSLSGERPAQAAETVSSPSRFWDSGAKAESGLWMVQLRGLLQADWGEDRRVLGEAGAGVRCREASSALGSDFPPR